MNFFFLRGSLNLLPKVNQKKNTTVWTDEIPQQFKATELFYNEYQWFANLDYEKEDKNVQLS